MVIHKTSLRAFLMGTVVFSAAAVPALAQQVSGSGDRAAIADIVVTAQKREQRLSDVPAAILATAGDELAQRNITTKDQLMALVPDLRVTSVTGGLGQNLSIRGIGPANNYNLNVLVPVGLYQDEIYQTFTTYPGSQMFDLSRVEVLKGPQGTLYGRNTTGGAINFISNQPGLQGGQYHGNISVGYGNYDRLELRGASDLTLIDDVLGIRVAFLQTQRNGYVKNVGATGPDTFGSDNTTAGRFLLAYKPTSNFKATLGLYYTDFKGSIPAAIPVGVAPGDDVGYYSRAGLSKYEAELDFFAPHSARNYYGGLTLNWDMGDVSLTSISSYGKAKGRVSNDCDSTPVQICRSDIFPRTDQASQDLRIFYDAGPLQLTTGVNYGWDKFKQIFNVGFGTTYLRNSYTQIRDTYGIFADVTYALSDALELTGGLRYTKDSIQFKDAQTELVTGSVSGPPTGFFTMPLQPTAKRKTDGVTGRFIVTYEFLPDVRFYASYSKGYRGGAFNGVQLLSPIELNFVGPEKTQNIEAGIKGSPNPMIQFAFDVFYMKLKNQQVQSLINIPACPTCNPPTSAAAYAALAGLKGRNYGAELDLSIRPSDRLKLSLQGTYLNTRYASGIDQQVSNFNVGGNRFPFAPKLSIRSGIDIVALDDSDSKLTLTANASYTSRYWFDPANGKNSFPGFFASRDGQKQYTTVDARILYEIGDFEISLWANNIFDKFYLIGGANTQASFGSDQVSLGAPRTFGGSIGMKF
ncbi:MULTISPECIES: TonB-dependent receptor [Sphingobium]|uniref:TonB-dependent receptor n=1 Tax=Sphingobium TaxID=165695 RepID=UPI00159CA8CE|nr:TonB-dependent receptor [Sphingobium sp. 15-1]